jgi:hypothetical protein
MDVFPELDESLTIRSIWDVSGGFVFFLDVSQNANVTATSR